MCWSSYYTEKHIVDTHANDNRNKAGKEIHIEQNERTKKQYDCVTYFADEILRIRTQLHRIIFSYKSTIHILDTPDL